MNALKQFLSRLSPKHRKAALYGATLLVLFATVGGIMFRSEGARATGGALRSPDSIFADRSPGVRMGGVLLQTKPKYATNPRARQRPSPIGLVPHERVLSTGRTRPAAPPAQLFPSEGPLAVLQGGPGPLVPGFGFDTPLPVGPGFDVPPFGFGDTPGFTGTPGNPGTDTPTPGGPGSAVPELATWLMMIVGIGAIGQAARRRRSVHVLERA